MWEVNIKNNHNVMMQIMTYRNYRQQLYWALRAYWGKYLCQVCSSH
jgi:hypothetical protein